MKNKLMTNEKKRKRLYRLFQLIAVYALIGGNLLAQDFQIVRDGIEYAQFTRRIKEENVVFNALRLDLTKVRLDVVHAMDAAIGTETTSSMATRYGAVAAINAGFFRLDRSIFLGDPTGVLMINGKVLSESNANRIALFIENKSNETKVSINHLELSGSLLIGKQTYHSIGINRQRTDNDLVIYTPEFHRSTLTSSNGLEIVVQKNKVIQIYDGKGGSLIPSDGFIISASGKKRDALLGFVKTGAKTKYQFSSINFGGGATTNPVKEPAPFTTSEDIIGGVPELVRNGKIEIPWEQEKSSRAFVETKHPRTAVAKLKDGKFLLVTVDGRSQESAGIALQDLAQVFLEMGATDAMNLDGGGSTTMFLDGKIVNRPSDKEGERKVSDAILVFPRK